MAGSTAPDTLQLPLPPAALRGKAVDERARLISGYLCRVLTGALDVPPAHRVSAERSLRAQGLNSLTALRLTRTLRLALRVDVPVDLLLTHDTVTELATALAARLEEPTRTALLEEPPRTALLGKEPSRTARPGPSPHLLG
ncbi:acyl carrier protein [Streptomyces boluensis]|uniref:Carrier domain-containing protein n=1 Tax=Streptomyces boluensis TaxID=1775135 RepID=A0A964UJQ3_9ACTN|nr:acyl carrier protein [Streptomyces boluensis]NBE49917.1 hypothetical protein [Streptomyces boluensis]